MGANQPLRAALERAAYRSAPGSWASWQQIAEAVNACLWQETGCRYGIDARHPARLERDGVVLSSAGTVRRPAAGHGGSAILAGRSARRRLVPIWIMSYKWPTS